MPNATAVETLSGTEPADAERWRTLVSTARSPDVYYLPEYARANCELENSEPLAIVAGADDCRILAPLLVRPMSAAVGDSRVEWLDACSPYGYGGLLNLSSKDTVDARDLHNFFDGLHNWCCDHRVVCCVIRLHPLLRQEEWFTPKEYWQKFLRLEVRGSTSGIDLGDWDAQLRRPRSLRKDRRSDLNLARRALRVAWKGGEDHDAEASLDLFFKLYSQSLDKHHSDEFYRFSPSYFSHLAALRSHLGIAFVSLGEELMGANMFMAGSVYAHGHLAFTNEAGKKNGAATLLIVEGADWARERGCKILHLGGGMSSGDSLEYYKRSFGGPSYRYAYVNYIADPERFEQICRIPTPPWPYRLSEV